MDIRKAKPNELNQIESLYKSVIESEFCMWNEYYPTMEDILFDQNHGNLYVLEENSEIYGVISVVEYSELGSFDVWSEPNSPWIEISRLVISKNHQNKGLASFFVQQISEYLKDNGMQYLRLSVAKNNIPAIKTYNKLGFNIVGEYVEYDIDFYLCEKKLEKESIF